MAHGLKTPLAVLDALARGIEDEHPALAAEIGEQSLAMQEQVFRALARARTAAAVGLKELRTPIPPVVDRLVSAMKRLPNSDRLTWRVAVPADAVYCGAEGDLLEMLGNLVDNARKWARNEVRITVLTTDRSGSSKSKTMGRAWMRLKCPRSDVDCAGTSPCQVPASASRSRRSWLRRPAASCP